MRLLRWAIWVLGGLGIHNMAPSDRTLAVPLEARGLVVPDEARGLVVPDEARTLTVPLEG